MLHYNMVTYYILILILITINYHNCEICYKDDDCDIGAYCKLNMTSVNIVQQLLENILNKLMNYYLAEIENEFYECNLLLHWFRRMDYLRMYAINYNHVKLITNREDELIQRKFNETWTLNMYSMSFIFKKLYSNSCDPSDTVEYFNQSNSIKSIIVSLYKLTKMCDVHSIAVAPPIDLITIFSATDYKYLELIDATVYAGCLIIQHEAKHHIFQCNEDTTMINYYFYFTNLFVILIAVTYLIGVLIWHIIILWLPNNFKNY